MNEEDKSININEKDAFSQTVLDHMVYSSKTPESIDNILKAGGKSGRTDGELYGLLLERVTTYYNDQVREYGQDSVKRQLDNINILLKNGVEFYDDKQKDNFFKALANNETLIKQYPEQIVEILAHSNDNLQARMDTMRSKLGNKVGKTADVETGRVTEEHRQKAKEQANISKAIMKAKRAKEGK